MFRTITETSGNVYKNSINLGNRHPDAYICSASYRCGMEIIMEYVY